MKASICLNTIRRADKNILLSEFGDAVTMVDGWIQDVHFFSNISIALRFVLSAKSGSSFAKSLEAQPMNFDADDLADVTELPAGQDEEDNCTLQITFFHHDPDLRRHIASVPG